MPWRPTLTKIAVGLLITNAAVAQPFGLPMGTPVEKLNVIKPEPPFGYEVMPAKPHPGLTTYHVFATPNEGLCKIVAGTSMLKNDSEGYQARNVFKTLTAQLSEKYGPSKLFDFLHSGSIWREPQDWAMSVYENERNYDRFWDKAERSTLSSGIESIHLSIGSLGHDTLVTLEIQYVNFRQCSARMKELGTDAL